MKRRNILPVIPFLGLICFALMSAAGCPGGSGNPPPPPPLPPLSFQPSVFSPDGQWVYFSKAASWSESELWKINVNGTGLQKVRDNSTTPSLVEHAWINHATASLYVIEGGSLWKSDLLGGGAVELSPLNTLQWNFSISPDGLEAATSDYFWDGSSMVGALVTLDTDMPANTIAYPISSNELSSWGFSPGGDKIAAVVNRPSPAELHMMSADGTSHIQINGYTDSVNWPDISHSISDAWVYYTDVDSSYQWDIYRVNWDGSVIENITNTPNSSETNPVVRPDLKKSFSRRTAQPTITASGR